MAGTSQQPSQIATEDAARPDDNHVVTDDLDYFQRQQSSEAAKPADSNKAAPGDDKSPGQKPDDKPAASDDKDKQQRNRGTANPRSERRIAKLSKDLAQKDADLQAERQRNKTLTEELAAARKGAAAADPKPDIKDFDSPEEYGEAFADWKAKQDAAKKPPAEDLDKDDPDKGKGTRAKPSDQQPAAHSNIDEEEIEDFHARGKKEHGDAFAEALDKPGTAVDDSMAEFLMDSDHGPAIYIYLSQHQDESRDIFKASTREKMRLLEELEGKADAGKLIRAEGDLDQDDDDQDTDDKGGGGQQARGGRQTRAGDPPSDTKQPGAAAPAPDPENESMDEYAARRAKEEAAKRGFKV